MNVKEKRYGQWSGNPQGTHYVGGRCAEEVWPSDEWYPRQCWNPSGHGQDGLFCGRHKDRRLEPTQRKVDPGRPKSE